MAYEFFNEWAPIFMAKLQDDFDLSLEDSAAIIGNAGHESGGFKSLQEKKPVVPGSRGGYGIMQWTGPRRRDYEAYCSRNKLNPADMDTNYKFLFVELRGPEGAALTPLRAAKGLDKKVESFMNKFLRPGIPHLESRIIWAKRALQAWDQAQRPVRRSSDEVIAVQPEKVEASVAPVSEAKGGFLNTILDLVVAAIRAR